MCKFICLILIFLLGFSCCNFFRNYEEQLIAKEMQVEESTVVNEESNLLSDGKKAGKELKKPPTSFSSYRIVMDIKTSRLEFSFNMLKRINNLLSTIRKSTVIENTELISLKGYVLKNDKKEFYEVE